MRSFYGHIQLLKLAKYRIDNRKVLDFIIVQILDDESCISKNPEKYKGFVERFVEDYACADLPFKLQNSYCFITRDVLTNKHTLGLHCSSIKTIYYKRASINSLLLQKNVEVFDTIFHENTHAVQNYDFESSNIDTFNKYLMIKERILRREKEDYYFENYSDVFVEIDARQRAREKLSKLINKLPEKTRQQVLKRLVSVKLGFDPGEREGEFSRGYKKINVFDKNKPKESVSTIFDEIIKKNPNYLIEFPILSVEYNSDGSLKTLPDIVQSIDNTDSKSNRAIYVALIKKGNVVKPENIESDLDFLLNYDIKNEKVSPAFTIIYTHIINTFIDKIEEMTPEGKKRAYDIIDKITDKLKEIEEKEKRSLTEKSFRHALTRKNHQTKKSLLDRLNEERQKDNSEKGEKPEASLMAGAYYSTTKEQRDKAKQDMVDSVHINSTDDKPEGKIDTGKEGEIDDLI